MRNERGYTLLEVVVSLAIFGMFLAILVTLTAEMRAFEKRLPINYMAHPSVGATMSRLRRDVFDTIYYPTAFQTYSQTPKVLLLYVQRESGAGETVIYDFQTPGEVHQKVFTATMLKSEWIAHGMPVFTIATFATSGPTFNPVPFDAAKDFSFSRNQAAMRISAVDPSGQTAIDFIAIPRPLHP